eukprot:3262899-Amphidinium_carterae.1
MISSASWLFKGIFGRHNEQKSFTKLAEYSGLFWGKQYGVHDIMDKNHLINYSWPQSANPRGRGGTPPITFFKMTFRSV